MAPEWGAKLSCPSPAYPRRPDPNRFSVQPLITPFRSLNDTDSYTDTLPIPVLRPVDHPQRTRRRGRGRRASWVESPQTPWVDGMPERPSRGSKIARSVLSAGAMLAVAAMAVVTSVPANAFLSDAQTAAAVSASRVSQPGQELATSTADVGFTQRDGYTVTDPAPAPAPVAAPVAPAAVAPAAPSAATVPSAPSAPRAVASSAVRWPFDGAVRISDGYGPRVSPCAGCSTFHLGTDFLPGEGNPVYAIADGVVKSISSAGSLGVHVVIDHTINGQLIETTSAHMRTGSVRVSVGQAVRGGDIVGLVGNTGSSTGPHLHFELRLNGTTPTDSNVWLRQHAG